MFFNPKKMWKLTKVYKRSLYLSEKNTLWFMNK